jgi:hypothetical protein
MRRWSWSLTLVGFASIRFEMVLRLSQNRPFLVFAQRCVKRQEIKRLGFPDATG